MSNIASNSAPPANKVANPKVITTKQLRENMANIVRDLQLGRQIKLSYRHKVIGILQPINHNEVREPQPRRGSPEAIRAALDEIDFDTTPSHFRDSKLTIKELIAEQRDTDFRSRT